MEEHREKRSAAVSSERLNFILAVCAILISAASFYATYLQANSAERQVKAMTLPLIQFSHGNFDMERDMRSIDFTLKNAGVGPAIIKSVDTVYDGESYASFQSFLMACCGDEVQKFREAWEAGSQEHKVTGTGDWISQPVEDVIIPGQTEYTFQQLDDGGHTNELWEKLNDERWKLSLDICYCSMLEECYRTEGRGEAIQVASCAASN